MGAAKIADAMNRNPVVTGAVSATGLLEHETSWNKTRRGCTDHHGATWQISSAPARHGRRRIPCAAAQSSGAERSNERSQPPPWWVWSMPSEGGYVRSPAGRCPAPLDTGLDRTRGRASERTRAPTSPSASLSRTVAITLLRQLSTRHRWTRFTKQGARTRHSSSSASPSANGSSPTCLETIQNFAKF